MGQPLSVAARLRRGSGLVIRLAAAAQGELGGSREQASDGSGADRGAPQRGARQPLRQRCLEQADDPPSGVGIDPPPARQAQKAQKRFLPPFPPHLFLLTFSSPRPWVCGVCERCVNDMLCMLAIECLWVSRMREIRTSGLMRAKVTAYAGPSLLDREPTPPAPSFLTSVYFPGGQNPQNTHQNKSGRQLLRVAGLAGAKPRPKWIWQICWLSSLVFRAVDPQPHLEHFK